MTETFITLLVLGIAAGVVAVSRPMNDQKASRLAEPMFCRPVNVSWVGKMMFL